MRFYPTHHQVYCGIALHAPSMSIWIVSHDGELLLHRPLKAAPEPFLKAISHYRDGLVVAGEGLFTWYWLADLWAHEGMPFGLGPALSMKAIHGGKAKNDKIDSPTMAALLPPASGYPAQMRAARDLVRRRTHLMRNQADLLAHVHKTNSQYTRPEIGKKNRV